MDFGSPANLLRKDIWISFSCTWPLWLVGWLVEYLGEYCQMAMGHSFVRHLLCSRHPGTIFCPGLNDKLANLHHLVSLIGEWRRRPLALQVKDTKRRGRTIFHLIFELMSHNSRKWQGCPESCGGLSYLAHLSIVQRVVNMKSLTFKLSTTTIPKYLFFSQSWHTLLFSGKFLFCSFLLKAKVW